MTEPEIARAYHARDRSALEFDLRIQQLGQVAEGQLSGGVWVAVVPVDSQAKLWSKPRIAQRELEAVVRSQTIVSMTPQPDIGDARIHFRRIEMSAPDLLTGGCVPWACLRDGGEYLRAFPGYSARNVQEVNSRLGSAGTVVTPTLILESLAIALQEYRALCARFRIRGEVGLRCGIGSQHGMAYFDLRARESAPRFCHERNATESLVSIEELMEPGGILKSIRAPVVDLYSTFGLDQSEMIAIDGTVDPDVFGAASRATVAKWCRRVAEPMRIEA